MSGFLKLVVAASVCVSALAVELQFDGARFPLSSYDKHNGYASRNAQIDGKDREVVFENIIRTGETYNNVTFGLIVDIKGIPLKQIGCAPAAAAKGISTQSHGTTCDPVTLPGLELSHSLDYSSFLPIAGTDRYRVISHFEASIGQMSMFEVTLDKSTCKFSNVEKLSNIDWSESHGLWNPCAGALSPWGTHLGSEEYEPDARWLSRGPTNYDSASMQMVNSTLATLKAAGQIYNTLQYIRYFNVYPEMVKTMEDIYAVYKPYRYGYANEVTSEDGIKSVAKKCWAIGRKAFEMLLVMPDSKTAYGTDDGSSGLITKYVMKNAKDLSEGTLYAAKITQKLPMGSLSEDPYQAGEFTIDWVDMGMATDKLIRDAAEKLDFTDIFTVEEPKAEISPGVAPAGGWCNTGFTSVNTVRQECLKLKPNMEIIASRLEMRRYAALMGATVEWNKMEGISLDIANNKLYLGISSVDKGMSDSPTRYDKGGNAQIAVPENKCGCVYEMQMGFSATTGQSTYSANTMKAAVCGRPSTLGSDSQSYKDGNRCDVNSIANPDNIWYDNKYNSLYIAEDTSSHQNDVMWQFNPVTASLVRVVSSPYGAEITSSEFHHFGECDIFEIVFQHPYGETDKDKLKEAGNSGAGAYLSYMSMPEKKAAAASTPSMATSAIPTAFPTAKSSSKKVGFSVFLGAVSAMSGLFMLML